MVYTALKTHAWLFVLSIVFIYIFTPNYWKKNFLLLPLSKNSVVVLSELVIVRCLNDRYLESVDGLNIQLLYIGIFNCPLVSSGTRTDARQRSGTTQRETPSASRRHISRRRPSATFSGTCKFFDFSQIWYW